MSLLASALALAVAVCAATPSSIFAGNAALAVPESWAPTDHIVGDTLGRGIELILRPVHAGLSEGYFLLFKSPVPEHITTIKTQDEHAGTHP
jgi:hypothetical protein